MATKRVTITINDQPVELVLRSSSVEDGLLRGNLMAKAYNAKDTLSHEAQIAATLLHPVCVACVREPRAIREMPLDDFLQLDETEVNTWVETAYELNPHWKIKVDDKAAAPDPEAEKKIGTPLSGSSESTSPETPATISQP